MVRFSACLAVVSCLALSSVAACGAVSASSVRAPIEAGPDAAVLEETGGSGEDVALLDGGPFDVASACAPGSLASFTPTYHAPTGPYTGACSSQQLDYAVSYCFGPMGPAKECTAWATKENTPCLDCLVGPENGMGWAPLLYVTNGGEALFVDVAACVVLSDPAQLKCGQSIEYLAECELSACLAACPISTTTIDAGPLDECIRKAVRGGCATYARDVDDCAASLTSETSTSPAAYCFDVSPTDSTDLRHFLTLACGQFPSTTDGGAPPPPTDAAHFD